MKKLSFRALVLTSLMLGTLPIQSAEPASRHLTSENTAALHQLCQPKANETLWRTIPWHPNFWSAREQAAKLGKPIYLWEMDGHPLGCT